VPGPAAALKIRGSPFYLRATISDFALTFSATTTSASASRRECVSFCDLVPPFLLCCLPNLGLAAPNAYEWFVNVETTFDEIRLAVTSMRRESASVDGRAANDVLLTECRCILCRACLSFCIKLSATLFCTFH